MKLAFAFARDAKKNDETKAEFLLVLGELGGTVTTSRPTLASKPLPRAITQRVISEPSNPEPTLLCLEYLAVELGLATEFTNVVDSLRCSPLASSSDEPDAVMAEALEPAVVYPEQVRWYCRTAPATIAVPEVKGVVLLSSLAHAIDEDWLRWRGVTHIVCCLGKYAGREVAPPWSQAMQHRLPEILYLEWNPSNERDWQRAASYCAAIHQEVDCRGTVMLFHCLNGKDRSPMAIFAYLRLWLQMTHKDALQLLDARHSTTGKRLFDVYANFALKWLKKELERKSEWGHLRSSGQSQMTWHAGNV